MSIEINRKSGVPLYIQIKQYICAQINNHNWHPGYKLPPERDFAKMLGVSRNTVSMAYKELEDENRLISRQGKGTFVVEETLSNQKKMLSKLMDDAIEEAIQQGYSNEDILSMVSQIINKKSEELRKVNILFIECNNEQVDFFAKELSSESGIYVEPLVISEIKDRQQFLKYIKKFDLIVTTYFHYDQVKSLVGTYEIGVLAISLAPQLETMIRIAQLKKDECLGLICITDIFAEMVHQLIISAGIKVKVFNYTITKDVDELRKFITSCNFILTSPGRKKEVMALANEDTEVIEFVYRPDVGSVNTLKKAVLNFKRRSSKERVK